MSQFQGGQRVRIADVPGVMPDYIRGCTATVRELASEQATAPLMAEVAYWVLVDLKRYDWASAQPRAHVVPEQYLVSTQAN